MPIDLTPAERETHLNQTGDNHDLWIVTTDDPFWKNRLQKLGFTPVEKQGVLHTYHLTAANITIRRTRTMSDEQRARLRERGKRLAQSRQEAQ